MSALRQRLATSLRGAAVSRRGAGFLGAVGVGLGCLSYGVYRSSRFFARLTHWDSAKVGVYLGGVGTAAGLALTGRAYRLFTLPSVDRVVSDVMVLLRGSREVRQQVGGTLRTGQFKAYAYGGGARIQSPVNRDSWVPRSPISLSPKNLQVMFQLLGERSSGMVSLQIQRRPLFLRRQGHAERYASLAVDFRDGERLVLAGDPGGVVFQGYTRLR